MSAYGHEMEWNNSARRLSSRGGSDMGSSYVADSGFYMSSSVATIFICGLMTVGVLVITLLVTLAVMLQSCESKSAGVVEFSRDDHNHCRTYALHAELNGLELGSFPSNCKDFIIWYFKEEQYSRDLTYVMQLVQDYFNSLKQVDDGVDMVMIDLDDIFPSKSHDERLSLRREINRDDCKDLFHEVHKAQRLKHTLTLRLYLKLRDGGWPLVLISRKSEEQMNATIEYLKSAGYGGWSLLIMRSDGELKMDNLQFFSMQRQKLQEQGYQFTGIISSHMDALTGPFPGKRIFKLPNPAYCNFADPIYE